MFEPSCFSIIFKRDPSLRERELVNSYWGFDNNNLSKFKSTITSLNVEFSDLKLKTHSSISNTVSELAYLSTPDCKCSQCGQLIQFKTRSEIKYLADREHVLKNIEFFKNKICISCEEKNLQVKVIQSATSIIELVDKLESLKINIQDDFESLSYIEQLYLSMYSQHSRSTGRVQIDKSIIDEDCDLNITRLLIEKGYLIDLSMENSLINNICELKTDIHVHQDYLTVELRNKVESCLSRIPPHGIYISYTYDTELKAYINDQIKKIDNLSYAQLQEIELIVKKVLLKQAEDIIHIAADYFRIDANYDEAFRHTLEIATWQHSMRLVCNLIFYQSKSMAAEIQAQKVPYISRKFYLRRSIESHLNYLRENQEAKKYYSNLPQKVVVPAIVDFVIMTFMKDELSWDALSGQEIVAKWVNFNGYDENT